MAFMFEKLEVYQKAVDFTGELAVLTEGYRSTGTAKEKGAAKRLAQLRNRLIGERRRPSEGLYLI